VPWKYSALGLLFSSFHSEFWIAGNAIQFIAWLKTTPLPAVDGFLLQRPTRLGESVYGSGLLFGLGRLGRARRCGHWKT
jgi:hypothetical protein